MKKILLLLLLCSAFAYQIADPKLVSELHTTISQSGTVTALGGTIYDLSLNVTIPQDVEYQEVSSNHDYVIGGENNQFVYLFEPNPQANYSYEINSDTITKERVINDLPKEYIIPEEYTKYLEESPLALTNSPKTKQLAMEITKDQHTDFQKISALAIWVNENVDYNSNLVGLKKDSDWVIDHQEGVCVEFSSLFIALARSLGYPARYVLGQTYGNYGWLGHAWAEVYIGEWVPVDPTWLEVGHLDATHVEFYKSIDAEANSKVIAHVTGQTNIFWDKPDFSGKQTNNTRIDLVDIEYGKRLEKNLVAAQTSLGFEQQTIVYATFTSPDYRVIQATLTPCSGDTKILDIEQETKSVILEPGELKTISWLVTTENLDSNIVYTCPLTLNSQHLDTTTIDLEVKEQDFSVITASLGSDSIVLGEQQTIFVETEPGQKINVLSNNEVKMITATKELTEVSFTPNTLGKQKVFVFTNEATKQLSFNVVRSSNITATNFEFPTQLMQGKPFTTSVLIENKGNFSEEILVQATYGNQIKSQKFVLTEPQKISFDFVSEEEYSAVSITVRGGGQEFTKTGFVTVLPLPSVEYNGLNVRDDGVELRFKLSNSPENISLTTLKGDKQLSSERILVPLNAGSQNISWAWYDVLGNNYSSQETIFVSFESRTAPSIVKNTLLITGVIFGVALILFLVIILRKFLRKPNKPYNYRHKMNKPKMSFVKRIKK